MNPKKIYLLGLFLAISIMLFSQTNDRIKRESDKNKREGKKSSNASNDNSDIAQGCAEGCGNGGCGLFTELSATILEGLIAADKNIKESETEIPRIKSIELGFNLGYVDPNSTLTMPSLKLRGGLLSTHLRIFSNTEQHGKGKNNYTTINWQIVQFNLIVQEKFNFALGTGILYETYSKQTFNEFGFSLEFYPGNKFYIPLEFKYTPDYRTGKTVLFETHTGLGYTVKKWKNSALRFQINYTYGNYYETVKVNGFSAGFCLLIDTGHSRIKK
jgi:hypothetical protein